MTFDVGDLVRPIEDIWQHSSSSILSKNTTYRAKKVKFGRIYDGIYIETLDGLAIDPPHGIWNAVFFELCVNDKFSLGELI